MSPGMDGPWTWLVALSGFFIHAILWGIIYSFGIFYVALLKDFPGKESETAWIMSISFGAIMITTPLTIRLCRRFSPRVVCCTGILLASVSLYLSSLAPNLVTLYVTFGIMYAMATNFSYLPVILVLRTNCDKHLGLAFGISNTGSGVGGIVFGLVLPSLVEARDWRGTFQFLSYLTMGFVVCGLVMISRVQKGKEIESNFELGDQALEKKSVCLLTKRTWLRGINFSQSSPWRNRAFIVLSIAIYLASFVTPIPYCHIVNFAIQQGVTRSEGDRLPLFVSIGSTVGRLAVGRMSGYRVTYVTLCQITFLVLCLATTLCTMATSTAWLILFAVVFGLFDGGFCVLIGLVVDDIFTDKQTAVRALGNLFALFCIPYVFGSPFAGWLYKVTGSYHTVFFCCGAMLFVSSSLMSLVRYLLPDRTSVETPENVVVSSDDNISTTLVSKTDLQNPNTASRLLDTKMCSLLDLSVEIYSDSINATNNCKSCQCSRDYLFFAPRIDPSRSVRDYFCKHEIPNGSLYTDITAQISGTSDVGFPLSNRERCFVHVNKRTKCQQFDDVKTSRDLTLMSGNHVFDTGSLDDANEFFGSCSDIITDDKGYFSASATASFEDSETKSLSSQNETDWKFSVLDSSLVSFDQELVTECRPNCQKIKNGNNNLTSI